MCAAMSPSMRREWIEMFHFRNDTSGGFPSPSMRREWIEMAVTARYQATSPVSLHAEGVD